ncbi:major capsid protein [Chicken microvirus mg7_16]|nr:major capsid protein [Chicken microvirus mg7_16]
MPSINKKTQHLFSRVPATDIPRSVFDRSHNVKTTFDSGYLVPFYVDEVLPGDSFKADCSVFARLATPIVPIMDNLYLETFFFFVPTRLLWDHWQAMNGEQENPDDSTDYLVPTVSGTNVATTTLWDYFGLPTNVAKALTVSALPFRAYNLIYNEWFRDENLIDSVPFSKGDGPDKLTDYKLLRRGKRHDYFTSALPWPQKGPGVEISLGGFADLVPDTDRKIKVVSGSAYPKGTQVPAGEVFGYLPSAGTDVMFQTQNSSKSSGSTGNLAPTYFESIGLRADLSVASPITINDLREAFQLQRLYERDARGGTRYTEILRAHFGVVSPDARLQRPEYLGGSSSRININPVVQNSQTTDVTPQGNLAAYGVAGDVFHGFTKSFVEHGYIIGLMNVRADLTYQQGLNRMWSRRGRFDFYWPALAHLGEQAVLNKEIYAQGTDADDEVFGYQERFAEYRYFPNQITGKFRSSDPQSLDVWHLAQDFASLPVLSEEFISDNPPVERVIAVQNEPQFLVDTWMSLKCARPMPVYAVPGLIDHF